MASLWAGQPDPKPVKRHRASGAQEKQIRKTFADACCTSCGQPPPAERHHVLPRSQSGDDVIENLCPLCRVCHTKLEGHESGWEKVAAAVRQYVVKNNERRRYQETHAGESFNRRYPPLANTDQQFLDDRAALFARHAALLSEPGRVQGHSGDTDKPGLGGGSGSVLPPLPAPPGSESNEEIEGHSR